MVPRGTASYDVLVVGAGHAGCEAALACARLGLTTGLLTLDADRVAEMSCNPAIGGLGKSQIVREVDALGGEMGRAADASAIQFRRLNASKGPAVRARRVQCDLRAYHAYMRAQVEGCPNLSLIIGCAEKIKLETMGQVCGVELADGTGLGAQVVVLTTGTFLRGLMHVGLEQKVGGRQGDGVASNLTASLNKAGLSTGRFKTGTPPRLLADSIDFECLEAQPSDEVLLPFSHESEELNLLAGRRVVCHLTCTNPQTHRIISSGLDRSPLFCGVIEGTGPRYCPSIEDKVVRFHDRESHHVVLEPTDASCELIYPNGISTSLPLGVQTDMVHSIAGLERAHIAQPGYAVEYDYVLPTQLLHSLEVRGLPGLFLAGQINGTSGYEEAAGQGLLAGLNAAARVRGSQPVVLARQQAYLGVMVDDLVTRGTLEPYRMFSSRAEFRLLLREDNACERLAEVSRACGLVSEPVLQVRTEGLKALDALMVELSQKRTAFEAGGQHQRLEKILRRPQVRIVDLLGLLDGNYDPEVLERAEVRIKYQGYVDRQLREAQRLTSQDGRAVPQGLDFSSIPGLSNELADKLSRDCPADFGSARRIDGMTPAALMLLSVFLDRRGSGGNVPRGTLPGE
jgi:tRNA uridine 5-carboxymethylaminomethyl modification enzyme